jgi:hypothetical protein
MGTQTCGLRMNPRVISAMSVQVLRGFCPWVSSVSASFKIGKFSPDDICRTYRGQPYGDVRPSDCHLCPSISDHKA